MTKLLPLEFRVFRRLEPAGLSGERVLVACSGGRDSIGLAACLARLQKRLGLSVALGCVHHGPSSSPETEKARLQAFELVEKTARELGVEFYGLRRDAGELRSEQALRDHRLALLKECAREKDFDRIAFGHHADDLFETRVIRLLRGTGCAGIRAMKEIGSGTVRPFLTEKRSAIAEYVSKRGLEWIEDPTNADTGALRNWVRHVWLPALEAKRSGGSASFARSLSLMADVCDSSAQNESTSVVTGTGIDRHAYSELGIPERRRALAAYLRQLGVREFRSTHIEEIRKRVEGSKKVVRFELFSLSWDVNAEQIRAFPTQNLHKL